MAFRSASAVLILALVCAGGTAAAGFDDDFTGRTLRVDYYHSGHANEERLALDRVRIEGPWAGPRVRLVDTTNLGSYFVEVADVATNRVLYTRGFSSIYGEWETTAEALAGTWRTLPEALRVPEPRRPFQLRLRKRNAGGGFREIWSVTIDPGARYVDRATAPAGAVWTVFENGPAANHVDLLVLGDGYAAADQSRFHDDVRRLVGALFEVEPFRSRRASFNVRALDTPAAESGVTRPRAGLYRASPLGTRYDTFDSERYVLTLDDRAWRDAAAAAPYDAVLMLVHARTYGGGGIFNLYSTAATGSAFAPYLVVHEFGHAFAALADEYFTSPVAYVEQDDTLPEPWEPNVTATTDRARIKWGDLVAADVPLPTPWDHDAWEARSREFQARRQALRESGAPEEEMEKLFLEERAWSTAALGGEKHAGRIGAFEGAAYRSRGLYRPASDCIMMTRDEVGFCAVCRRAIERVIDSHE